MKKTYTKRQIQEAIAYWEKQLAEDTTWAKKCAIHFECVCGGRRQSEEFQEMCCVKRDGSLDIQDALFSMLQHFGRQGLFVDKITSCVVNGVDMTAEAEEHRGETYAIALAAALGA